ncbi:MAG: RNA methyltransferase [Clostridium sp.]|nr:RNA methyltransferase [Bacteroides sp.]MCM1199387.1 RNA methyltransferase [Clostridium sp.]
MSTSISNNEIKRIKALSQKKFRDEAGLFIAEGEKIVEEAVRSGCSIEKIYRRDEIGEEAMSRISQLASPSPVLAVIRKPDGCDAFLNPSKGLYLGLDSMRDPGNLGTVIRIADWFGIDAIYATHDTVDVYNPKVVQATMGAIFRIRLIYCDLVKTTEAFISAGGKVYGTFLDGNNIYRNTLDTGEHSPVMIVVGNESEGISDAMGKVVSDRLFIPPYPADDPGSESLNAAVATAVTVAEFRRRIY